MSVYAWILVIVAFGMIEAFTMDLTSIWFAFGALGGLLVSSMNGSLFMQLAAFALLSGILLLAVRPVAKKYFTPKSSSTNADRIIGQNAVVTQSIIPENNEGQIKVLGQIWSAHSVDSGDIETGCKVEVISIVGVKAVVKRV